MNSLPTRKRNPIGGRFWNHQVVGARPARPQACSLVSVKYWRDTGDPRTLRPGGSSGSATNQGTNTGGALSTAATNTGGAALVRGGNGGSPSTSTTNTGGATSSQGGKAGSTSTTNTGGAPSTGGTTAVPAGGSGAASTGGSTSTGPCAYECTDFCLNAGGETMPGTCTKAGYVCCNVAATESSATGTQYYIDSKSGNDSNDGTSEATAWKSLTKIKSAGIYNLKRGSVWETTGAISLTNSTKRPYGTGPRPVINGKKTIVLQSLATVVLKGKSVLDAVKVTQC